MAIDLLSERILSFAQAAKECPRLRAGRAVAPSTLWRWARRGIASIRLETATYGGRVVTSAEALGRFLRAVDAARRGVSADPSGLNTAATSNDDPGSLLFGRRAEHHLQVEAELAARGV